jgi:E1A/CREB-binding protein
MLEEFQADVLLTFDNAMLYNEEGSIVHHMAKEMKTTFISDCVKLTKALQ